MIIFVSFADFIPQVIWVTDLTRFIVVVDGICNLDRLLIQILIVSIYSVPKTYTLQ